MLGTFHLGDRLTIEPLSIDEIRCGDLVVFQASDGQDGPVEYVHRAIGIAPCGVVTRGDNNPRVDTALVTATNLLGRVTHVERDGAIRPVRGGRLGLWRARLVHARQYLRRLGRQPYVRLRESRLMCYLWRPYISQVHLATDDGPLIKYLSKGRTVARWWPEEGRFECRKPYDLVIPRPNGTT